MNHTMSEAGRGKLGSNSSRSSSSSESEGKLSALEPPDLSGHARPARVTVASATTFEPWISLDHPVTLYEGAKMVLMLPVVLVKARAMLLGPCGALARPGGLL